MTRFDQNVFFSPKNVSFQKMNPALATVLVIWSFLAQSSSATEVKCTSNGFFRHPDDCTRFYRCVDLTGRGYFQIYTFSCPAGTVFDENVSVCNHKWAAPPCDNNEESGNDGDEIVESGNESVENVMETVIIGDTQHRFLIDRFVKRRRSRA